MPAVICFCPQVDKRLLWSLFLGQKKIILFIHITIKNNYYISNLRTILKKKINFYSGNAYIRLLYRQPLSLLYIIKLVAIISISMPVVDLIRGLVFCYNIHIHIDIQGTCTRTTESPCPVRCGRRVCRLDCAVVKRIGITGRRVFED